MTAPAEEFMMAACSWTPAADGLSVASVGTQREGGLVGPYDLHLVRRRRPAGRGYEYGLAWVRGSLITSYLFGATFLGSVGWPWEEGCASAVTWFKTRREALALAVSS